ncbi:GNAT family N-acetyltransferase [Pontiellaceae bacterium B12219]|nr:GNAT family N-acetyltransferase [Pontiellaceae bacterium B12219]
MFLVQATTDHILHAAKLFDLYRQFYDQPANAPLAESYIRQRIVNDESTIFLAFEDGAAVGFVQLYPSFCSVDAIRIQILYDLYVKEEFRRKGIARSLMNKAREYSKATGAKRIDLSTGVENKAGQALYEKLGYSRSQDDFIGYALEL